MHEELAAIGETLHAVLAAQVTAQVLRDADAGAFAAGVWSALDETGVLLATASEAAGGLGLGLAEAAFIVRVAAAHAAPVPLAETLLAHWLLAHADTHTTAVSAERLTVHMAAAGSGPGDAGAVSIRGLPWARHADAAIIATPHARGSVLQRLSLAGADVQRGANLADEPRDDVTVRAANVAPARLIVPVTGARIEEACALLRAAQLVGAMEAAVALAVTYANERVAFGRPIGKFQAIQHHIAVSAERVAAAAVAVEHAAAMATDPGKAPLIWTAKALASEAAGHVAAATHQVHGAIGFTREYRLQPLTRRLWSWREDNGNERYWYAKLGALVQANGADALWPWLTALER